MPTVVTTPLTVNITTSTVKMTSHTVDHNHSRGFIAWALVTDTGDILPRDIIQLNELDLGTIFSMADAEYDIMKKNKEILADGMSYVYEALKRAMYKWLVIFIQT